MEIIQQNDVRYIRNEENLGLAASRNKAIKVARADFFSFCDDDDLWPPSLGKTLVDACRSSNCDIALAYSKKNDLLVKFFNAKPLLSELFYFGLTPPVGSQVYRTQVLRKVSGYSEVILSGVDHDIWVKLLSQKPSVCAVLGIQAIANSNLDIERITNIETKRRTNIAKSLDIWRKDIEKYLGRDFYIHFCKSYEEHNDYRFFYQDLSQKKLLSALKRLCRRRLIAVISRKIFYRITRLEQAGTFPRFKHDATGGYLS